MKLEFSGQIFEKYRIISYFMKICSMGVELFLADRQTDVTQLIVAFPNFANAPKNGRISLRKTVRRRRENKESETKHDRSKWMLFHQR
jgi:hypothetical protein